MSDLKQGTRVYFEVTPELTGYGKIVGKSIENLPTIGGTYIIEPEQQLPNIYPYSHFTLSENQFKVLITNNGLSNAEFNEIRKGLSKDSELLQNIINSQTGHLGDIIASIETLRSSLLLKTNKLKILFTKQKPNKL